MNATNLRYNLPHIEHAHLCAYGWKNFWLEFKIKQGTNAYRRYGDRVPYTLSMAKKGEIKIFRSILTAINFCKRHRIKIVILPDDTNIFKDRPGGKKKENFEFDGFVFD